MAPRPAWKGYLKLSLVTCAVELTNATTQSEKVHFRVINRETGNTVKRQYVDSVTGKPIKDEDEVKGFEIGADEYLLIEEDEIDAVQIESSHTLNLEGFVSKSDIEQVYLDTPYYVTPADEVSEEAFAVIRDAMQDKKMSGLARIVLYRRERPVVIEPLDKGMLLTTLRYDKTVRKADDVFDGMKDVRIDKDMVDLASGIIDRRKMKFDPSKFEDKYEDALMDLIEAKKKGRKPPKSKPSAEPSNVVNLFDALKKSLASESGRDGSRKSQPAKKGKSTSRSDKKRKSA
ncbi:MAG: Ku protein [Rhizobiaceae bacterium]